MSLCGAQGATKAQETLLPDQATLHAQAIEESMIPIRPGVPGKSPFWNRYARMFAYVPSFEFTKVPGAVHYRFTATAKADGKDYVFVVANPWATLAPIWPDVPVGDVALKVEGLGREGQVLGLAGTQAFYRAAVFNGPYGKPLMEYRQSARRALESMYRQKYVRNWKVNGKPDEASNSLYSYPDILIGGGVVRSRPSRAGDRCHESPRFSEHGRRLARGIWDRGDRAPTQGEAGSADRADAGAPYRSAAIAGRRRSLRDDPQPGRRDG
jgi:hypothetical protein